MTERAYIGNIEQLFNVKRYTFAEGYSKGVEAVDIQNGSGLDATILLDKCMDIYQLKYKGKNLNFITPTGIVSPLFYNALGTEWIKTWEAGFLTTCGLSNIGAPCKDNGQDYGLHGRIHNTPSEKIKIDLVETDDMISCIVEGTIPQATMFGENLVLQRKIISRYKINELCIEDKIVNKGFKREPLLLLYHFNIGYPLLSEKARYSIPSVKVLARDEYAHKYINEWNKIESPQNDFQEMCYYHELKPNIDNSYTVGIDNDAEKLFLRIRYSSDILDKFVQWKMFGTGEYVSGLEPCNTTIDGRDDARKKDLLKWLEPGQSVTCKFCIAVSDDKEEVTKYEK